MLAGWSEILIIIKDRATRGARAAQALARRKRLRCASDSLYLNHCDRLSMISVLKLEKTGGKATAKRFRSSTL
jgi:hypothetical protein